MPSFQPKADAKCRRAFTLIELLVVIGIIALLMALLMPALNRVRQTAQTLGCATNLRTIGHSMFLFAQDQAGRLPGGGQLYDPSSGWGSSISWANQLTELRYTPAPIQQMGTRPSKGQLYCPAMNTPEEINKYPRAYRMSLYMAGGPSWGDNPYPYGKQVEVYWYPHEKVYRMYVGAPVSMARRPAVMFLVSENERSNDYADGAAAEPGYPNIPHSNPASVPWAHGPDNTWAFRHGGGVLATSHDDPNWPSWQANFLFVDGHVERLGTRDEILTARRNRF